MNSLQPREWQKVDACVENQVLVKSHYRTRHRKQLDFELPIDHRIQQPIGLLMED